jgi:transglutaminase-like putative cysteine protease
MAVTRLPGVFVVPRWEALIPPPPKLPPEESILLRVLVQGLVLVGIVATDLAGGTTFSFWTIPLSVVGAIFSWQRRRERNIALKFLLALAMLAALGHFFANLLGSPNDTRLALAGLLVHLQVIHSFDLPRRKDLGYSMVIGLVLIGVAGTLSQTLDFAVALGLFALLALPTLHLDYRSRLGLPPVSGRATLRFAPPLALAALAALAAAGLVFVLLPRLPGYQFRAFPVSPDLPMPREFSPERIRNPGYPAREGKGGKGGRAAGGGDQEAERFDPVQYAGFNDELSLGLAGQMKPTLMLRVRAQAPSFWRVMAFERYTGHSWLAVEGKPTTFERQRFLQVIHLLRPNSRLDTREVVQTFNVLHDLPNVIPAAHWPAQLYFPSPRVAVDRAGGLRSPSMLLEGTTYTVISAVPIRDVARLRAAGRRYPPRVVQGYLQLPPDLDPAIAREAHSVADRHRDPYVQALTLTQHLKQTYSLLPKPEPPRGEAVAHFLGRAHGGTPEQFASVLTVMLRSLGIPARLVTGFTSGHYNPFTGYYEVYNTDATALVEVYFPDYGWLPFDPVPGRPLIPPSLDRADDFGLARDTGRALLAWLPPWLRSALLGALGVVVALFAWIATGLGQLGNLAALAVLAGLGLLVVILALAWRLGRSLASELRLRRLAPAEQAWQRALALLARRGLRHERQETPTEFEARVARAFPAAAPAMTVLATAYQTWRYGNRPADRRALATELVRLRRALGRASLKFG